jgi:hypothetical protein
MSEPGAETTFGPPPKLDHEQLVAAQREILSAPRRDYGLAARMLFRLLDAVYGKDHSFGKFKVLELTARVPYQAWEQAAYVAMTHVHENVRFARRIHDRIAESRAQQDNEQWHLLIINDLLYQAGAREGRLRFYWLPQLLAFGYYQLSWVLFVVRPTSSYLLNADFEDHAEHEYMSFVAENPDWENTPFHSEVAAEYGTFASVADVFRQIGHDEHVHKQESLHKVTQATARFQAPPGTISHEQWRSGP